MHQPFRFHLFQGFDSSSQSVNTFSFASSKSGFGASDTQQASVAQPPSGFGAAPPSASTFSFAAPAADDKPTASGFSFKTSSSAGGFGSASAPDVGDRLFTAHSDLTAEELKEFRAKRFTLGQIPLKPPPADLLQV